MASSWFLFFSYHNDARSNKHQIHNRKFLEIWNLIHFYIRNEPNPYPQIPSVVSFRSGWYGSVQAWTAYSDLSYLVGIFKGRDILRNHGTREQVIWIFQPLYLKTSLNFNNNISVFDFNFVFKIFPLSLKSAVAQWLRCCATNWKVAGSIPAGISGFFNDIKSFRTHYDPGVDSASNRNEYQEYFLGVKAAGA